MSRSRCSLLLSLTVAGLALSPSPSTALAQGDDFRTGTHVLRRLLANRKFTALSQWQQLAEAPERTLLILIGKPADDMGRSNWQVPGGMAAFLQNGGGVLLASDHAVGDPEVRAICGYAPAGDRVSAWIPEDRRGPDEKFIYRGREAGLRECIIVEPTATRDPPLFWDNGGGPKAEPLRIVTNRPSSLLRFQGAADVQVLAQFPRHCWYAAPGQLPRQSPFPGRFAVSREIGTSRLLMLSDHSVFINEMLLQEDNGNLDFAFNTIEWLRDQRRDRVLIIEDGAIQSELDTPLREPEDALRRFLRGRAPAFNDLILQLQKKHQQDHFLDETLIEGINHVSGQFPFPRPRPENYYLLLIGLTTAALALFGVSRLIRASHGTGLGATFVSFGSRLRAATSTLALRERSALISDALREYAREAIREWFAGLPGHPLEGVGEVPPRVESNGGWWRRRRLRTEVQVYWRAARGKPLRRLSQADFRKLLHRLDELRALIDAGHLKIEQNPLAA